MRISRECPIGDDRGSAKKKVQGEEEAARTLRGHELIEGGVNLSKIGTDAVYTGGFKFAAGSLDHREQTQIVMEMGDRVGVSLRRNGGGKSAQFLLGLPDGEYLGVVYDAPAHSKHLPSSAIVDSKQASANLLYYVEAEMPSSCGLIALTFPALSSRVQVEDIKESVEAAFTHYKSVKHRFSKSGFGGFLYAQLEMAYCKDDETFYLHFHVFLEARNYDANKSSIHEVLNENMPWVGGHSGVELKKVAPRDAMRFISYGTKPSQTAVTIAAAGHESTFRDYYDATSGKRLTRTENGLKACLATLKATGRRAKLQRCDSTGDTHVVLVEKVGVGTCKTPATGQTPHSSSDRTEQSEAQTNSNVYCGSSPATPAPGGRLLAFGFVQNFNEQQLPELLSREKRGMFYKANEEARVAWERNTKEKFDLETFLSPLAFEVLAAIKASLFKSYTVIFSPKVYDVLRHIEASIADRRREWADNLM
ncbi:hypothetical protein N1037_07150 [Phaeobacter sp. G2]|nr:hypothetical protein N1037_07150 [Phaeobacter sp. G2]